MILVLTQNQVVEDNQLLDIARDYLQFVTNFFEVIDVSATHIYHSALELSPLSSIIRQLYYSQRPLLPRVVIGIPDLWDPSLTPISTTYSQYISSAWSPCGQFFAAMTWETLEIRDASTLKLLSTIKAIKVVTEFRPGLTYSPDGCSLAGCSNIGIMIWDTQTGGLVKIIACCVTGSGLRLVWSLDGMTIGTISPWMSGAHIVYTYGVASGVIQSSSAVQSTGTSHLWAHDKSFWVMVTAGDHQGWAINIFEVGTTLTRVKQFPIRSHFSPGVFSPTTYRISTLGPEDTGHELLILDIRSSEVLLQEVCFYGQHTFSPDGAFFAATGQDHLLIWRYTSGHYTRWREFQQTPTALQFSPASSSILSCAHTLLCISHLDSPASLAIGSAIKTRGQPRVAFSPNCAYIVTAHWGESTVAITNLDSQPPSPSQFIDTDFEILAIILTGNVLLVKGPHIVVAWLLTEEGVVDGMFGNTRADLNDSLWMIGPPQPIQLPRQSFDYEVEVGDLRFSVEGEVAALGHNGHAFHTYNMRTGDILGLDKAPPFDHHSKYTLLSGCKLYNHNLLKCHGPLEYDWPVSQTTLRGGWVKDQEGKHRLWLHVCWRFLNYKYWFNNGTSLWLIDSSNLVIIRF
jgi:hypothetical protein